MFVIVSGFILIIFWTKVHFLEGGMSMHNPAWAGAKTLLRWAVCRTEKESSIEVAATLR